jgi:ABC-type lipoprotein export system ATPase subunit
MPANPQEESGKMFLLSGISKTYHMGTEKIRALDNVDLTIRDGEIIAIIGPSGSGKSTLMHILGFMDKPTAGKILFDGRDVSDLRPAEQANIRSSKIGFVFQAFNLLPRLSVLENVKLPYSYYRGHHQDPTEMAFQALDKVGMRPRATHRPSQLSGGERQRVAIARALANDPRLILADEPTGNLDSKNATNILELFVRLNEAGHTVIIVTHDENVAAYANRRVSVFDGRLDELERPAESTSTIPPR